MRGIQMKRTLIRLGLTALISSALFGCGGGSDGVSGSNLVVQVSPSTPASTVASNKSTPSSASVQAWRALEPKITVTGVSINSPPVVSFAVTDANGAAVVGLGNRSQGTSATSSSVSALANLSFTFAKLVPATATAPSKWVSYLVTRPITVEQKDGSIKQADADNASCTTIVDMTWCGTYPTTDKEGTLVDNGDGTYKYTFYRDIKQVASVVASLPDSKNGLKFKADLGDLTYDPSLTHRVGIVISGAAPGTGTNVPNATQVVPGTNIAIPANLVYDFRPDGGAVTSTRNVVDIASCASCHNAKGLSPHGGSRKDPNLCVTCHTDQVRYGMSGEAKRNPANPKLLTGTIQNETSVLDGRAIGNYPNMIHKFHMGDKLSLKGYNYIPNSSGVGIKFETEKWIQDPRDCTKCHNGSYDPTVGLTGTALAAAETDKLNIAKITKDGDNWKTKPSRLACGACHDDLSFTAPDVLDSNSKSTGQTATGLTSHAGGLATDDSSCASCHSVSTSGATNPIDVAHRTETPTANNPVQITGVASISYEIKSVTVDDATGIPSITFRILKNGTAVPFADFATPTPAQNTATSGNTIKGVYAVPSTFEPITGFRGGPTFYVAYAMPQDGITNPEDFNTYASASLGSLLVSSGYPNAGSLAPASDAADAKLGYLTATLTGTNGQVVTTAAPLPVTATTTPIACAQPIDSTTGLPTTVNGYCANPSRIKIPTTAKRVTGAMIGTFTQVAFTTGDTVALTAKFNPTNGSVSKGLPIKTDLKKLVASRCTTTKCTAYTARRVIVNTGKCESCHEQLGTAVVFHGGARNDPTACAICHNTSKSSSGWSANASTFIHGIHAGTNTGSGGAGTNYNTGKRTVPFTWVSANYPSVVYPGILKRCDNCHVPNAVNFGATGATIQPNLLWSTSGTGNYGASNTLLPRIGTALQYVTTGFEYGNVFSYTPEGSVIPRITTAAGAFNADALTVAPAGGTTIAADPATLVESPITSACFACHDSAVAQAHMKDNGGTIYGPRAASMAKPVETCLICHGMGRDQDAAVVHAK
jgi:OmcA/MtrC family decaheme c-type cytochrome